MAKRSTRRAEDRRLYVVVLLGAILGLGHHVDHVIRGNHVGWPITDDVNAFTVSLAAYPIILVGLYLFRTDQVGPGFWSILSAGGAVFLAAIHFGPGAIEPPADIIELYERRILGYLAFGWLLLLIGVLVASSVYEAILWGRRRRDRPVVPPAAPERVP